MPALDPCGTDDLRERVIAFPHFDRRRGKEKAETVVRFYDRRVLIVRKDDMTRSRRENLLRLAVWAGASLALVACRHAPSPPSLASGQSAFTFIEAPSPTESARQGEMTTGPRQPVDVLVAAEPILPLATPEYPAAALGRQRVPALIGVRITVDERGWVTDVAPSQKALTMPGPFVAEFQAAVQTAVAQWHFRPAEKRHLVPGRGGPMKEDYWVVTRAEKTEAVFDVAFTFTASGDVLSGGAR